MERIKLLETEYIPKNLEEGTLYVSLEYGVACHLCPCGCGIKVVTPLGPTDWQFKEENGEPTLYPSIGNWQFPCRSHYWIQKGLIKWSYQWDEEEILAGRNMEEKRRECYYQKLDQKNEKRSVAQRVVDWFKTKCNALLK